MNTPEDKQLSFLYNQTDRDLPATHIDEAILAAAKRETTSRPRSSYGPFSDNWRVPAALAAVLVMSVGLVSLIDNVPASGIEEMQMPQAEFQMADSIASAKEVQQPAKTKRKAEERLFPETLKHDEVKEQLIVTKQVAKKRISNDVEQARRTDITGGRLSPTTVEAIRKLRLAEKIKQANLSADAFIQYHFEDNLTRKNTVLSIQEWETLIF